MDILHIGLPALLSWQNLLSVVLGCGIGLWAGALPGLGGLTAQAMLLPLTYSMDPLTALLLLTSVHTAAEYGGSISSILMNVPGDATAAAAAYDGYPMARQGKAGIALGISSASSLFGAICGTIILITAAQPILRFVVSFGPVEYFALGTLGITIVSAVSSGSFLKGFLMVLLGFAVGFVGVDSVIGVPRYTFGNVNLLAGIGFVPVVTGIFGISELMFMVQKGENVSETGRLTGSLWEGVAASIRYWPAALKSLAVGSILGAMPGIGATATNFLAYSIVKRTSRNPDSFGTGNPEGVVAPEVANNACIHAAMIPAFTIGIPAGASSAMLIVVLTIHGLRPGQALFTANPILINGLFAGLFASAVTSFVLMTVFIRVFARVTLVPIPLLAPVLMILTLVAAYSEQQSMTDLLIATGAGVIGYFLRRAGFPLVNLIMGLILGKLLEVSLVQAKMMGGGTYDLFFERPWAAAVLCACALIILSALLRPLYGKIMARGASA
jgi:putative tricarboxylic transport membrane protein